jgi:hypothetical protein
MTQYERLAVIDALCREFGFRWPRTERWMQGGRCPCCNQRRLFVFAADPQLVRCNRANKCDFEVSTRVLFPDIFDPQPWLEKVRILARTKARCA